MKRIITLCALFCAVMAGRAGEIVLCDFEDCNVGDVFQVESIFAPGVASTDGTAVVVEDPTNPDNKVLKVSIKNWNTFVRYDLPDGISGQNLLDHYQKISFDLYRVPSQTNDYMQTAILLGGAGDGSTTLYWDSSYPFLGNRGEWVPKSYDFNRIYNESTCILLGLHCDVVEYYIDNIRLSGVSSVETDTIRWTASVSNQWDVAQTANFAAIEDAIDNFTPVVFNTGNRVIFDDNSMTTGGYKALNVQIRETVEPSTVIFDNDVIAYRLSVVDGASGYLTGGGQLIIEGSKPVTLDVDNKMVKGTVLKGGTLRMGKQGIDLLGGSLLADGGGTINACPDNSSNNYITLNAPITLTDGDTLNMYLSRYTYMMSPLTGSGVVNIYAGGERVYLANEKAKEYPSWDQFTGTVNVYKYTDVNASAGYYGVILGSGTTFNPSSVEESIIAGNVNSMFANKTLVLQEGAAIAAESGIRGYRIGELQTKPGSRIYGYIKSSDTPASYYLVGNSNTDALLAGQIAPFGADRPVVGLIKEGTGTYTLTCDSNVITGGIQVLAGKVLIDNDIKKAEAEGLTGAAYTAGTANTVFVGGTIGGSGNIASDIDVYGTLEPGSNGIGTLTLRNFAKENDTVSIYLRPTTVLSFEIASPQHHDSLVVDGNLIYYNITEDFIESSDLPVVEIKTDDSFVYNEGDEYVLITAKGKGSLYGDPWNFNVKLPETGVWTVEERTTDKGIQLVLIAGDAAGVENAVAESEPRVYADNGIIYVETAAGDQVTVYSLLGQQLQSFIASEGVNTINDVKGMVVVKIGERTYKVTNF